MIFDFRNFLVEAYSVFLSNKTIIFKDMKWSKYNFLFSTNENKYLLYNSLTNSFMQVDEETYNLFANFENNLEEIINSELKPTLVRQKVLVEDDAMEIAELTFLEFLSRTNNKNLFLTIAPTYDCNFECTYCYEENRSKIYMTDETINQLVNFIKSYGDVSVNITWYGGEPLMALTLIEKICNLLEKSNIKFKHTIVTNGFLLNHKSSELFEKYPLDSIQITIDGPSEIHNARRCLKGNKPTFERILTNVDEFCKQLPNSKIAFRVNVDKGNAEYFHQISQELTTRYENKQVHIYAGIVDDLANSKANNCIFDRSALMSFKLHQFRQYSRDLGIYPEFGRRHCVANTLNGYVIGADGLIFKCWNDIGCEDKAISSLNLPKIRNKSLLYKYLNTGENVNDPLCKDCILLPICNGGCQYQRILKYFHNSEVDICHIAKDNLKELLEVYYEANFNKNE